MAKSFTSPVAFKTSLETRLKVVASQRAVPINSLRLKLVMERLLARLFITPSQPWLLKGGYAMELRYRPHARTTRDIDLTCAADGATELAARIYIARDQLQAAAEFDLGDYLIFQIKEAQSELAGAPLGGARFPCEAFLAGKLYGQFHIDLGFGDETGTSPESLLGDDLLEFAGIPPARVLAISKTQQFSEKIHAYTLPREGRVNTRAKDLVDMVLLIETSSVEPRKVAAAVKATFTRRNTHEIPIDLVDPPPAWSDQFRVMAAEVRLNASTLPVAIGTLREFWKKVTE